MSANASESTSANARLLEESRHFELRHACEDCVHFARDRESCSHGYPNAMHLRRAVLERGDIEFCKEFELG